MARDWLRTVHEAKVSVGHAERTRDRFEQDAFPWIGARPIAQIDAPELLTVLRRVTARGAIETANRLKDACGQVFRFGIATGACMRNPAADLRDALPPVPTRHLAAVVEPKRAGELLRAIGDCAGHPVTRAALALSAMLFLRPGELRQLERAWIDMEQALITIYSLWNPKEEQAKTICKTLGEAFERGRVVMGGVVKANGRANLRVTTFLRDARGLLVDRSQDVMRAGATDVDLLPALKAAIARAAAEGKPYTKTGGNGVYECRHELPQAFHGIGKHRLADWVGTLLDREELVMAMDQGSKLVKWLDVPGGPVASGQAVFVTGHLGRSGAGRPVGD